MAQKSSFPAWVYDNSPIPDPLGHGERAVQFLRALQHPKSKAPGRAFTLYPWQERIIRAIYGPRDTDGDRIVTRVFFYIPRGNRKTTLSAALALLHLIGPEKVPGGEIVFAASDKKQASIAFKEAIGIIRMNQRLVKATKIIDQRNAAKEVHSLVKITKLGLRLFLLMDHGRTVDRPHLFWPMKSTPGKRLVVPKC